MPAAVAPPFTGFICGESQDGGKALGARGMDVGEAVLVAVSGLGCALAAKPELSVAAVAHIKLLGVCDFGGCWSGHVVPFGFWVKAWPGGDA